jgi:uncharacterized membrane protein YccF (DUF307 family)
MIFLPEGTMSTQAPNSERPVRVIAQPRRGPGCLIQILWFFFVGWWLGLVLIGVAWVLNITIIGLPLGLAILNHIPRVLALQEPQTQLQAVNVGGTTVITETARPQLNFLLRALYFVVIGWWWSAIWLAVAYLLCATIIFMPVGLGMFRRTPAMTTLRRY